MLLMFLVGGVGSFGWMLVLGAVMAVEKNVLLGTEDRRCRSACSWSGLG